MDARQRGRQEPRERALTWLREATSKITSPTALQGPSRAHVRLSSLGAAKLGAEGHGYFWAGLAGRRGPPAPPKSQRKRGNRGPSRPVTATGHAASTWRRGPAGGPHAAALPPRADSLSKCPSALLACQGHAGPFSVHQARAGPLAGQRTTSTPKQPWALLSALQQSRP